ncbi:DUF4236 domain-containing protein [Amycolatopsis dendrobii]|uniref:DUF4236 domain-containing protein n=1 Tax=Amycolatopsis dendrobii TaxID=2760662 RepID=A0A7W3VXW7_9PSEU|nr:DUF4236 domain-containing protein [Amycolatopsis dendrobii]MBB1154682.1 DUF4236 domain-containing protein [Amycolatopsis dendrobii]
MSFYLRTRVKVGPLRVSMSRAGLGASVGVPGFRVGAGPRGAYVTLGGGLVSYRATTRSTAPSAPPLLPASDVVMADITGATTLEMAAADSSEFVSQLNDAARSMRRWPWVLVLALALAGASPWTLLAGVPLTVWVFLKDRIRRTVVVFYDVQDAGEARRFQGLVDAFGPVREARRAWHVVASGALSTTRQHKVNAGASALVKRHSLDRGIGGPPHLSANIAVPSLATGHRAAYFLPDRVLLREGKHYADVRYADLRIEADVQRFIESGSVPGDSRVVEHTWQYVNVKGGPDRRYKNNRRLPVLEYGSLRLSGPNGYRATFDFSTPRASSALAGSLRAMTAPIAPPVAVTPPEPDRIQVAPAAPLTRRRLSADGRISIVGEAHYQPALRRAARGMPAGDRFDQHLPAVALLVPEPRNPHDLHAVRVAAIHPAGTETVGYLSRSDARSYQPVLRALGDAGYAGTCPARITGGGNGRRYGMYLHLAGPDALEIANLVTEADLLTPERTVTVTKEENHQETLRHYHSGPLRTIVAAELAPSTVSSGKHKGSYAIEVRLDGQRVGELTAAMSARYRHLVTGAPRCEAFITHGARGFQLELRLPKADPVPR